MMKLACKTAIVLTVLCGLSLPVSPGFAQETEEFQTAGGKKKHRKRQAQPIKLGTSGSNVEDCTGFASCLGTLGALVEKNGVQFILSNNHVIGRSNSARAGEAILQPGYGDQQSCPAADPAADTVARFSARKRIKFGVDRRNKVDLAIAEVVPGAVRSDGNILRIGIPGSMPAEASVGMQVKKAGRTTGLTRGTVLMVNTSVTIPDYPVDCGGPETRLAIFNKQIIIAGADGKKFSDFGDSGSMIYEDIGTCPSPVGLFFASDGTFSAAAPASEVLKAVKKLRPRGGTASFVGCESAGFDTSSASSPVLPQRRIRKAGKALDEWREPLLDDPEIQAVGIGMTLSGPVEPAIYVLATEDRETMLDRLPEQINGYPVEVIKTDKFVAYCGQQPAP